LSANADFACWRKNLRLTFFCAASVGRRERIMEQLHNRTHTFHTASQATHDCVRFDFPCPSKENAAPPSKSAALLFRLATNGRLASEANSDCKHRRVQALLERCAILAPKRPLRDKTLGPSLVVLLVSLNDGQARKRHRGGHVLNGPHAKVFLMPRAQRSDQDSSGARVPASPHA